ncbi:MAG: hypothetical protein WC943_02035 [Elusimicrobiota bacterium]
MRASETKAFPRSQTWPESLRVTVWPLAAAGRVSAFSVCWANIEKDIAGLNAEAPWRPVRAEAAISSRVGLADTTETDSITTQERRIFFMTSS